MLWIALLFSMIASSALAQEGIPDQRKSRAFDTVTMQRNQAMDAVAICVGEFNAQVEQLKRELAEAKRTCEKPKEQ
jgi:hypothetical protein